MDSELLTKAQIMLETEEGRVSYLYNDKTGERFSLSDGNLSIGIGYNLQELGIPSKIIDALFQYSLDITVESLVRIFPNLFSYSDNRLLALVNLCFNIGAPRLKKFVKLIEAVEDEDWERASEEVLDSAYAKQLPERALRISRMIRLDIYPYK